MALSDPLGRPQATLSTISYIRSGAIDPARPIVFVFNGGPGASSATLNFGLLGPERGTKRPGNDVQGPFEPNPDTLLDVADLVMIDPVGTGFSRELRPGGGTAYWGVQSDVESIERAIRRWLATNDRAAAPIYIAGESYGGFRAGFLAAALSDLRLQGIVLISPGINLTETVSTDMVHVANIPSMAVAAVRHGRVPARGRAVAQIYNDAQAFASGEYLTALHKGNALTDAERDHVARRLSSLIGLPANLIAERDLRVDTQSFLEALVPGKVIGRLDDRIVGNPPPLRDPTRDPAADDPSLGLAGGTVQRSPAITGHLRKMGVTAPGDYVALSLDVNFRWDWRPQSSLWDANLALDATPAYAAFLERRPNARIFIAGGYYDLATPPASARHSLTRPELRTGRVLFRLYESGHSIADDPQARLVLLHDVRDFILHGLVR
jgi:carboxypeptidase C (cathepsin A)